MLNADMDSIPSALLRAGSSASGTAPFKILMVAGDPSGDVQGARVARALLRSLPGARIYGVGAARMREAGVLVLFDSTHYSAIGVAEAVRRIPALWRVFRTLRALLAASPPDLVLLIDFPAFNIRLARVARAQGRPVLYYFPPASWRKEMSESIRTMASVATRVATPFPWSAALIRQAGGDAEFVGHPLLELLRDVKPDQENVREEPIVALLPGSRRREVRYILPVMIEACREILRARPDVRPVVSRAPAIPEAWMRRMVKERLPQAAIRDDAHRLMAEATVGIIKSGTTTLEASVLGLPHVVCYAGSWFDRLQYYVFVRRAIRFIALPNILADQCIVPELYGATLSPRSLAAEVLRLLNDPETREGQREAFSRILLQMEARPGPGGAASPDRPQSGEAGGTALGATERVCEMALQMLQQSAAADEASVVPAEA